MVQKTGAVFLKEFWQGDSDAATGNHFDNMHGAESFPEMRKRGADCRELMDDIADSDISAPNAQAISQFVRSNDGEIGHLISITSKKLDGSGNELLWMFEALSSYPSGEIGTYHYLPIVYHGTTYLERRVIIPGKGKP